jgi:hypothetical protein
LQAIFFATTYKAAKLAPNSPTKPAAKVVNSGMVGAGVLGVFVLVGEFELLFEVDVVAVEVGVGVAVGVGVGVGDEGVGVGCHETSGGNCGVYAVEGAFRLSMSNIGAKLTRPTAKSYFKS